MIEHYGLLPFTGGGVSGALVEDLARLSAEERKEVLRKASAQRKPRIRMAIAEIRHVHLSTMTGRAAAREITAAVRGYRGKHATLRQHIVSQLEQELGHLEDVPGESAIRQMPEFQ